MSTFVLVHGSWQGAWAWDLLVPQIEALGHRAIAVDLPGNGFEPAPAIPVRLAHYADHLARILAVQPEPVILVGHSGGGIAITAAIEQVPERVRLAVYLCAFLLPAGMTNAGFYERYLQPHMRGAVARKTLSADAQSSTVNAADALEVFYQCADPGLARAAAAKLTACPEGPRHDPMPSTPERFGRVPRIYIETLQDRSVHLELQRTMQRLVPCREVISLNTDHAPQLSIPGVLAQVLDRL
jgi:pimeloyl-ACP methyl ester carboxylesterase